MAYPYKQPLGPQEAAAIAVLQAAGFVGDGNSWGKSRFHLPGTKRKATVGRGKVGFYEVPSWGKMRLKAVVKITDLERVKREAAAHPLDQPGTAASAP